MESNEREIVTAESGTVALLNKSEIDMQVATAHKYPRSVKKFRDEVLAMVTLNENVAEECMYSLPRREKDPATGNWVVKPIEGPSARFAEVVASAWGNSRAGSRIVNDQGDFVTAQGVFHDLEKNVAITYEVQRRITNSRGERFKPDMIGVTANAACSIALRNAILKGVPKAFWSDMFDQARETAIGNVQTLAARRSRALTVLQKMGVQSDTVFAFLKIAGIEDITLDHLATLFGITTAIKEGETTPEQAFAPQDEAAGKPAVRTPTRKETTDQATGEITPNRESAAAAPPAPPVVEPDAKPKAPTLASKNEQTFVSNRCKSNGIDLVELLAKYGVNSLDTMTTDQFIAIRDELPKAA
jgi:hypothetical protein